jgi:thiol-disulfide isomerase/thioredoxin
MPGLVACVSALALATAVGYRWRARNGKMVPREPGALVPRPVAEARGAAGTAGQPAAEQPDVPDISAAELGQPLGSRATLVQFSTAFCAPCRATRRILAEVAAMVDGVTHVEVDAESRLDLVRRLGVRRTPTTFVLRSDGRITHRASGQPRKADVIAALGRAV